MNYLVGDIGNTLIKISILNNNFKIKKSYNLETRKIYQKIYKEKFLNKFKKKNLYRKVLFSSVVPKAYKIIKNNLSKNKFSILEIKEINIKKIIKIKVKNYNQLGSDRISNAIGSLKYNNSIIIDFGTATTFDIVKNGTYEGGVISPGINLSILNLNKSTALLPVLNLKKIQKSYGKNTQEALNAGFLWGYEGLINNIIKRISSKSNLKFKIILTGGYAKLFKRYIKSKTIVDQNITIKGIAGIFKKMI
ncbi:MAG: type III pantothenate kinase [Candidatus Pelagibacter sp. TMED153]|nr:MAG: type III pantothenate kinase [Candidatus Pelagibacter sp. TMED153]